MHKDFFDLHAGHLLARANVIAERHGGRHVNIMDAGSPRGWFEVPSTGGTIDKARIDAITRDIAAAGGIDALRPKRDREKYIRAA